MPPGTWKAGGQWHAYNLYGLSLRSQWRLPYPQASRPGLAEVELYGGPASLFRTSKAAAHRRSRLNWAEQADLADGSTYLRWPGLFEFLVSADGRQIPCWPLNGSSCEAFHNFLLGPVLSFALLKQGIEPFHATTLVIGGRAIALVGDSGHGKSTLGASFVQGGHAVLTDDMLVLSEEGGEMRAYPGPPRIKLYPQIARRLLGERVSGVPLNDSTPKLIIPLTTTQTCTSPVPLAVFYVLRSSRAVGRRRITIRRLSQRHAFLALLRNTFNASVTTPDRLQRQFAACARIAARVPVKLLSYPRRLGLLPAVRQAILSDLARSGAEDGQPHLEGMPP